MVAEKYYAGEFRQSFDRDRLSDLDHDTQLEVMRTWFHQNFEDPAERTPYESAEGGYIWIWGGPYDAREELDGEFSDVISENIIDELATELERECVEWAPTPSPGDYDQSLFEDIARITEYCRTFSSAILDIEQLLETQPPEPVKGCFLRLLYVNVITALETYLSDVFISTVANDASLMRRFVETCPAFRSEKIPLADVYRAMEEIEKRARSYLIDVVWHHLDRVKEMYRATLAIEFPGNIGPIFRAIAKRHDIVHRNGKTKDGKEICISVAMVTDLISAIEKLVQHVDQEVAQLNGRGDR